MLTRLLAITGLAPMMTDFILGFGLNRIGFLLVLVVLYIVMGMFFDTLSMMLLTIPILLPSRRWRSARCGSACSSSSSASSA